MKATPKTLNRTKIVHGEPSWRIASTDVEAFVTQTGGHLAPVVFDRRGRKIQPYSVAPWSEEKISPPPPTVLRILRGDFFCLPFGGNSTPFRGEKHSIHGETSNARWNFESLETRVGRACLHLSLKLKARPGRVDKRIVLRDGQNIVYSQHIVSGVRGPLNPGHHAMLKFPEKPGSGLVSTSRFVYGQVFPGQFESPENGGYSYLKPGAEFESLAEVPTLNGETADLSRYPARRGFEDLVMLVNNSEAPMAWTAVTFPAERFVWFALKDPRILRETVLWLSNRGRHYPPWNGRHVNVMGLEDVTAYFHYGLTESARKNPISDKGYTTCFELTPDRPLIVPYIMGIAPIPAGFDRVASIEPVAGNQAIAVKSVNGKVVQASVNLNFLTDAIA